MAQIFGGTPVVLDESRSNICRLSGIEKLPNQQRNFSEKIDLDIKEIDLSIKNDLLNRDFTVDAIGIDLNTYDQEIKLIDFGLSKR